jgi:hypothetical protein
VTPARLASEPQTLLPADARAFAMPGRGTYRVRVSRRREGAAYVVARAVPAGSSRAASQVAFLAAVAAHPDLDRLRVDGRATVLEVAKHLAWTASWDTLTTRPTWEALCERTGRSRATIARALGRLRAAGLVGVVATGRSGAYSRAKVDAGTAEAAVYVLCVPSPLSPVDEVETPTDASPVSETHPPHARASESSAAPLRGRLLAAARLSAPVGHDLVPEWPLRPAEGLESGLEPSRPADGRDLPNDAKDGRRLGPARALQGRLPVLRRISDRHVASVVREFVLAGWTTSELVAALDRRPDGTAWPHDGAAGVDNVGAWLGYRLGAWRDEAGTVRTSPGRAAQAERVERIARQRAERDRAAAVVPAGPDSPGLASIRATLALHRRGRN